MSMTENKICVITGATSGIGKATAIQLAKLNIELVLIGRNPAKLEHTKQFIVEKTGNRNIHFFLADLSSQKDIVTVSSNIKKQYSYIDILINNAGAIVLTHKKSIDGVELTFALNHLSYFLLTNCLIDLLKIKSHARIINVSSIAHKNAIIDFNDIHNEKKYKPFTAYGQSKLANILFTYKLAKQLHGTGITVNAIHPGLISSDLIKNNNPGIIGRFLAYMHHLVGKRPEIAGKAITHLAYSQDLKSISGKYFDGNIETPSSDYSYNEEIWQKLWDVSLNFTK